MPSPVGWHAEPVPPPLTVTFVAVRAALLAGVITGTGTIAHTSAGGLLPAPGWMAYIFGTTLAVAAVAVREEAPTGRLVLLLAGGQGVVHLWLSFAAGHAHIAGQPDQHGLGHLLADGPMMLAHLAAAAVVGLWLGAGERAAFDLLTLGLWALLVVPLLLLRVPRPRMLAAHSVRPLLRTTLLADSLPRRGPPLLLGA